MKLALKPRLNELSELSDTDLGAFNVEIIDALGELPNDEGSVSPIGELGALQLAAEMVRRELGRRDGAALSAELSAELSDEAVTASGGASRNQLMRMAARQRGRLRRSPEASQPTRVKGTLQATSVLREVEPGSPIEDRMVLAKAMGETLGRMPRQGNPIGDILLASARWQYPEERYLTQDAARTGPLMDAVCHPHSLTATGGICLPVNVDYAVPTWATADRPIRDALPAFQASRGGIRYVQPPDIGGLAAATGIWTEATDLAPGAATKPIVSIACGSEQLVYVEAVSTRLGFGNMASRFAPEQVAANTDLAVAAAARVAENNLLNLIAAACVQNVTQGTGGGIGLGAARDLLTAVDQACAAYRNAHRIPRSQTLTAIFPDWLRDLIRIDLAREIGHAQTDVWNSLAVTNDQVDELLETRGLNPIWHLDGQPGSVSGGVAQVFAIQTGSGAILTFPSKVVWYLFVEGSIQFLDGGRLDLGVVRDSTLDATNDYECHDSRTEVLTRDRDWQLFADLDAADFVATRNARTGGIEFQRPTHHTVGPRKGHMHRFTTADGGELLVSPRHRMLVGEGPEVTERFMSARDIRAGDQRLIGLDGLHESWEHELVENYDDNVYCVTVPNETLLTRRPGCTPMLAGNTFVEVFENVAFRGFASGALQLVSTLCANGSSAGTIDTHTSCA
jgi:hypothetical protein